MLKLFDRNHSYLGQLTQLRDYKIESETASGDKTLSCVILKPPDVLMTEYYLRNETDEFVIKEINNVTGDFPSVIGALNLEELEAKAWKTFNVTNVTIAEAARTAITGTGWTVASSDVTKKRNAGILKKSALGVINDLCTAFMCEVSYDTINKTISFHSQKGSDRGVYFLSGLNLRKLTKKSSTYDFYTRIIPYGADDLDIKEVNNNKEYVENYQYSSKIRTYIWEDTNYTDAAALKEDAVAKLADMSKPEVSYSADVRDLAAMSETYSLLEYGIGDSITIIDKSTGTKDKQRIVKLTEYPDQPERNTCELSNLTLTWEEMNKKMSEAAAIVDALISPDGQYNGTIKVSDILHFEDGVVNSQSGTTLRQYIQSTDGTLALVQADIGTLKANQLTVEELDALYTRTTNLEANYATITNLNAVSADVQGINARVASIESAYISTAQVNTLLAGYATITLANIDTANISKGVIKDLFTEVGLITSATIVDGKITGYLDAVNVNAANITAGTLVADRIAIRGSNSSLVYALNNYGQITSQEVNTLDGYILTPRTITADRIVASSITGNEIAASTITANKLNVTTLSAVSADVGEVTAGILRSYDYTYSSGDYSDTGMLIDLSNKLIRAPKFAVTAAGVLYATDAILSGTITATDGNIGGWKISNNFQMAYEDPVVEGTASTQYGVYVRANASSSVPASAATTHFLVRHRSYDGSSYGTWTNDFFVRHDGQIYAPTGIIGPLTISADAAYSGTASAYRTGTGLRIGVGSNGYYYSVGSANSFYATLFAGELLMQNAADTQITSVGPDKIQIYSQPVNADVVSTKIEPGGITFYNGSTVGYALHSKNTFFTRNLSNGTKIGTLTINGTATDLYCQTNTNLITGVKGNVETDYRTGNVNLTCANIGALPLSGGTMTGRLITTALRISGHTGDIGNVSTANNANAVSLAAGTAKTCASITLAKGTWIVQCYITLPKPSSDTYVTMAFTTGANSSARQAEYHLNTTAMARVGILRVMIVASETTFYFSAVTGVAATIAAGNADITAIRIL